MSDTIKLDDYYDLRVVPLKEGRVFFELYHVSVIKGKSLIRAGQRDSFFAVYRETEVLIHNGVSVPVLGM